MSQTIRPTSTRMTMIKRATSQPTALELRRSNSCIFCTPLSICSVLLGNLVVDPGDHHDYQEEQYRPCEGVAVLAVVNVAVDIADDGTHIVVGTHLFAENTHDGGVLFHTAHDTGDEQVADLRRHHRGGDTPQNGIAAGTVDLRCVVVLLVDRLHSTEEYQDLEGKSRPDLVHYHDYVFCPGDLDSTEIPHGAACLDPLHRSQTETLKDVIDQADRFDIFLSTDDGEECREHRAHSKGVGEVGQEQYGLVSLLQCLDGIERDGDDECEQSAQRHGNDGEKQSIHQALVETRAAGAGIAANDADEVLEADALVGAGQAVVVLLESIDEGGEDGPECEYQHEYECRSHEEPTALCLHAAAELLAACELRTVIEDQVRLYLLGVPIAETAEEILDSGPFVHEPTLDTRTKVNPIPDEPVVPFGRGGTDVLFICHYLNLSSVSASNRNSL